MSRKEALTQFIQQIHGRPVVVKLNSGVDYRGLCFFFFIKKCLTLKTNVLTKYLFYIDFVEC